MDLLYGLAVFGLAFAGFACVVVLNSMTRRRLGVGDPVADLYRRWREAKEADRG